MTEQSVGVSVVEIPRKREILRHNEVVPQNDKTECWGVIGVPRKNAARYCGVGVGVPRKNIVYFRGVGFVEITHKCEILHFA